MSRARDLVDDAVPSSLKLGCGIAAFIAVALFALTIVFGSFAQVDAGHVGILTTFGRVEANVLTPGFNFKIPYAQSVYDYDVRVQVDRSKAAAASRDLQDVAAEVALNFHLKPGEVFTLHSEIGPEFKGRIIDPAIQEAFKATTAQYTASELVTQREAVKIKARDLLTERLAKYHIVVDDLNIVNFDFSKDFNAAIEAANVARQQVITAEQTLAKQKVEAQLRVAQAEADATAAVAQATGAATATRTRAEAEAFSIRATTEAVAQGYRAQVSALGGATNFVEYTRAKAWNGTVPTTVMGEGNAFLFGLNR
jgi:regulator of protease activity HflC (stomatin/prohibitin superfamily)